MRDLAVEQYLKWFGPALNWPWGEYPVYIKCTLWLCTTEMQDAPWTEASISTQRTQNPQIDNESTHSSDATVALGGPEAEGHPKDPVYSNHNKLTVLTREINHLHQWVGAGEGQWAVTLDHIECKLQNFSIALHPPPPSTPTEPFGEVIQQYTNTLCTTQKQSNLTNPLLQDIAVFNEHWLNQIGRIANRHRDSSIPHRWKQS